MKLRIIAVGRMKAGPERALYDHYAARVRPAIAMSEVEEKRPLSSAELKAREAELLLAALDEAKGKRAVVVLDEHGKTCSSRDFARRLQRFEQNGAQEVVFLVGGADGHGEAVLQRADLKLSLGAMTWPHMLVRGMLAEQLYRAQAILAGHPYHRD
ncbi:MAG TPA: 23S rRNA (pseudouridine(1915)-N(3))-methyltransferase RlmH [Dongiaceae bacterium]|jgi:23S rRNA (pseudouridine1915-N3)-methyltransferase|nr:23S rRNA (pseudouridine(1915)-N(3))-methyltransferase RlmH [Dongiaceae bacterium]